MAVIVSEHLSMGTYFRFQAQAGAVRIAAKLGEFFGQLEYPCGPKGLPGQQVVHPLCKHLFCL